MANPYFNATFYLQSNPDLLAAGVTVATAWDHYVNFGANEAYVAGGFTRAPNDWFDARFYLESNPDLITAGVTPDTALDHFAAFGAAELRSPNAQIAQNPVTDASLLAYVNANADVAAFAGVTVPATALTAAEQAAVVGQFYAYGIDEARPAAPTQYTPTPINPDPGQTFTLTTVVGENVVGTVGDDTFSAVVGTGGTWNIGDQIDGLAGTDTFNIVVADGATAIPAGASVKNVEIVNISYVGAAATDIIGTPVSSSSFVGVEQLWQIDNIAGGATFQNATVAADVTAGFRSNNAVATAAVPAQVATVTVAAASGSQSVLNVALDGVGSGSALTFNGAGVKTLNVSGSVAAQAAGNAGDLTLTQGTSVVETINLAATSAVDLVALDSFGTTLKTFDASASTGAIRANNTNGNDIDNSVLTNLGTVKLGSGSDNVLVTLGGNKALSIDTGAGNDTVVLTGAVTNDLNDVTLTLGAGKDTVNVSGVVNLGAGVATVAELTERIVTIEDFNTAEDVLNLGGNGIALNSTQLANIAAAADLRAAVIAVEAITADGGAGSTAVFSYGNDAYVFIDNTVGLLGATDGLIKLAGVDAAEFTNIQNGNLVL